MRTFLTMEIVYMKNKEILKRKQLLTTLEAAFWLG